MKAAACGKQHQAGAGRTHAHLHSRLQRRPPLHTPRPVACCRTCSAESQQSSRGEQGQALPGQLTALSLQHPVPSPPHLGVVHFQVEAVAQVGHGSPSAEAGQTTLCHEGHCCDDGLCHSACLQQPAAAAGCKSLSVGFCYVGKRASQAHTMVCLGPCWDSSCYRHSASEMRTNCCQHSRSVMPAAWQGGGDDNTTNSGRAGTSRTAKYARMTSSLKRLN